jgi:hypothetical protein
VATAVSTCVHHWDIDSRNNGVCTHCGEKKTFQAIPWFEEQPAERLAKKYPGLFITPAERRKEAKEGKEKMDANQKDIAKVVLENKDWGKVEPPLTTQPEFNSKPVEPVIEPAKKKIKESPHPCKICGEIILGRAMGGHMNTHRAGKPLPDAPPQASVTQGAASDAKQVVVLTGRTVLPLLPPYQEVPPDCRRLWFEIYADLVRK